MYKYVGTYSYRQFLAHHGILGQKWGIRRYQNEDGSLTPEGVRRYGANATTQQIRADINKREKDIVKSSSDIANKASGLVNDLNPSHYPVNVEKYRSVLEELDNEELQRRIQRMNLENQYARLTEERVNYARDVGYQAAKDALATTAAVVGIVGSGFMIYKNIKG